MILNADALFDILEKHDKKEGNQDSKADATEKVLVYSKNTSFVDLDEYNERKCGCTARAQISSAYNGMLGKRKISVASSSTSTGKFKERIRRNLVPTKHGKTKNVACGQDALVVPMDDSRMSKIAALMAKNRGFGDGVNMNDIHVMVDHFRVLMILRDAHIRNGHGKGDKYPRNLRVFFGSGGFARQDEIVDANKDKAYAIALRHVTKNVIQTQNIKIASYKVNAMQASEKQRNKHVKKLANNFMFGFNVYAQLLLDVKEGRIRLPNPRHKPEIRPGMSIYSCTGSSSDLLAVVEEPSDKRFKVVCDPASPCVSGQ